MLERVPRKSRTCEAENKKWNYRSQRIINGRLLHMNLYEHNSHVIGWLEPKVNMPIHIKIDASYMLIFESQKTPELFHKIVRMTVTQGILIERHAMPFLSAPRSGGSDLRLCH